MGRFLAWLLARKRRKKERETLAENTIAALARIEEQICDLRAALDERDARIEASLNNITEFLARPAPEEQITSRQLLSEYLYGANGDE